MLALSWALARQLSRPLDRLRERMQRLQPGAGVEAGGAPLPPQTSPELAAIESAWQSLQQRLAQHEQERALMLAGISDDLRSPLARIRLAAELLPDDPALAPRRDSLMRNVQVADRLIQSFLDHARALQQPLDQAVDLAALAREAVQAREGITATLPPQPLRLAAAHPLLLERVLANLLDNAAQHGRPPIVLRLAAHDGAAVLEVQDAGDGIPPAWRETALQAFARGDASRGRPGTGLGLAIVQQTVQRLGGRIEFDGRPGAHVVRLVLPLRPAG
jgi:two-component system osmolarity sensor histidine kinase EnvZ